MRTHTMQFGSLPTAVSIEPSWPSRCCVLCTLSVALLDRAVMVVSDLAEVPSRSPSSMCVELWWRKAAVVGVVFRSCNCRRRVDVVDSRHHTCMHLHACTAHNSN